ncbi:hypothetical protein FHG87_003111 [Trinorchestia longiramus]|nr:hypothetical protein FHG87_003111 [Trinorchestia longiramus]
MLHFYICLSSWLAVVTAVAVSTSYTQTRVGFGGDEVRVTAGNPVACGGRCVLHPQCGAYVFSPVHVKNCILMINSVIEIEEPGSGLFYSGTSLSTGALLHRVPLLNSALSEHLTKCESVGSGLVRFPTRLKDLVALQSYGTVFYDLTRRSESDVFTTHDGTQVDDSLVTFGSTFSSEITPQCVVGTYAELHRITCTAKITECRVNSEFVDFTDDSDIKIVDVDDEEERA